MLNLFPVAAFAAAPSTPTRTTKLEITASTPETDLLQTEGWKWEPAADGGGTLTLQNFYLQCPEDRIIHLDFPMGTDVTIHTIGDNVIEMTQLQDGYMLTTDADLTFTGEADSSLQFLIPTNLTTGFDWYPYAVFANSVALESGELYCNVDFAFTTYGVDLKGGSLTVEAGHLGPSTDAIYSTRGDVNFSGADVDIHAARSAVFVPGTGAAADAPVAVNITGGDVKLVADGSDASNCVVAKTIHIDTQSNLEVYGTRTALYVNHAGGKLEILDVGEEFSCTNSDASSVDAVYCVTGATLNIASADYTAVNEALAKVENLEEELYVDFSAVTAAVNKVDRTKNILQQEEVDEMAQVIEEAISALKYKEADYSKVDAAIAKANALNKEEYKDFSAVQAALDAVVRGKDITQQKEVDEMAKAIEDAISALEYQKADDTEDGSTQDENSQDDSPKTEDNSNLTLWICLCIAACVLLTGTVIYKRKNS